MSEPRRCPHGFLETAPRCPLGCGVMRIPADEVPPAFRNGKQPKPAKVKRVPWVRFGEVAK